MLVLAALATVEEVFTQVVQVSQETEARRMAPGAYDPSSTVKQLEVTYSPSPGSQV